MSTRSRPLAVAEGGYHSIDENVRKDGEHIRCEWHNRVITDDDGEVVGIISLFQDVTERVEHEQNLAQLRDFFAEAEELGALGAWGRRERNVDLDSGDAPHPRGRRRL